MLRWMLKLRLNSILRLVHCSVMWLMLCAAVIEGEVGAEADTDVNTEVDAEVEAEVGAEAEAEA